MTDFKPPAVDKFREEPILSSLIRLWFSSTTWTVNSVDSSGDDWGEAEVLAEGFAVSTDRQLRCPDFNRFKAFNGALDGWAIFCCTWYSSQCSRNASANRVMVIPSETECSINIPHTPSLPTMTFMNLSYQRLAEKLTEPCNTRANCWASVSHSFVLGERVASSRHKRNNACSMQRRLWLLMDSEDLIVINENEVFSSIELQPTFQQVLANMEPSFAMFGGEQTDRKHRFVGNTSVCRAATLAKVPNVLQSFHQISFQWHLTAFQTHKKKLNWLFN